MDANRVAPHRLNASKMRKGSVGRVAGAPHHKNAPARHLAVSLQVSSAAIFAAVVLWGAAQHNVPDGAEIDGIEFTP